MNYKKRTKEEGLKQLIEQNIEELYLQLLARHKEQVVFMFHYGEPYKFYCTEKIRLKDLDLRSEEVFSVISKIMKRYGDELITYKRIKFRSRVDSFNDRIDREFVFISQTDKRLLWIDIHDLGEGKYNLYLDFYTAEPLDEETMGFISDEIRKKLTIEQ